MFAAKLSLECVCSCVEARQQQGFQEASCQTKGKHFKTPWGLAVDRVWVQGYVCKVMRKSMIFYLSDGQHQLKVTCKNLKCAVPLPLVNQYVSVIGKLGLSNAPATAKPKTSSGVTIASAANSAFGNRSQDDSRGAPTESVGPASSTGTDIVSTRPQVMTITAHKVIIIAEHANRAALWARETEYLQKDVYPVVMARMYQQQAGQTPEREEVHQACPQQQQQILHGQQQQQGVCSLQPAGEQQQDLCSLQQAGEQQQARFQSLPQTPQLELVPLAATMPLHVQQLQDETPHPAHHDAPPLQESAVQRFKRMRLAVQRMRQDIDLTQHAQQGVSTPPPAWPHIGSTSSPERVPNSIGPDILQDNSGVCDLSQPVQAAEADDDIWQVLAVP